MQNKQSRASDSGICWYSCFSIKNLSRWIIDKHLHFYKKKMRLHKNLQIRKLLFSILNIWIILEIKLALKKKKINKEHYSLLIFTLCMYNLETITDHNLVNYQKICYFPWPTFDNSTLGTDPTSRNRIPLSNSLPHS